VHRLAIDIGGTFTDVVLDGDNVLYTAKVLTTPNDPERAVLDGVVKVLAEGRCRPSAVSLVLHGTTLATNALIERQGAVTALVTTEGHRDVLEMAYEDRFEQYDINIDRSVPLVPRHLRLTVPERMNALGQVLKPLDEKAVQALIQVITENSVTSVAVGLIHAYANDIHEKRIAEMLKAKMPKLSVTLASEVCPEIREYERLSTACANAYVKPLMSDYLHQLGRNLKEEGFDCPFLMMTSGGGLTTIENAMRFPIRLVESGPAGGAMLASSIAKNLSIERAISFDMGGTTAKICLIDEYSPVLSRAFEVDRSYRFKKGSGLPIRIPVIEMLEIGAGGGSIASVDKLARIRVGPESAGSEPGPACYGREGKEATVTDADLVMGRLSSERFAGGEMTLDKAASQESIDFSVAKPLRLSTNIAAFGISEVVDENMASAARSHAMEWGKSMQDRTLIAFGGAAPLHAAQLAEKLDIETIIVPPGAGVGSAIGFLVAPVSYEVVRSKYMLLSAFDPGPVNKVMKEMYDEAFDIVAGATSEKIMETRRAFMRYVGQGYEIAVPVPIQKITEAHLPVLRESFEVSYRRLYGRIIPGLEVEVLSWTLTLSSPSSSLGASCIEAEQDNDLLSDTTVEMFDPFQKTMVQSRHVSRESLRVGDVVHGPALITESQTTIVVPTRFQAEVSERADIILRSKKND